MLASVTFENLPKMALCEWGGARAKQALNNQKSTVRCRHERHDNAIKTPCKSSIKPKLG